MQFSLPAIFISALAVANAYGETFIPDDLSAGESYHLIFFTKNGRDALSPEIADYNSFVQHEAEQDGALTGTNAGVQYSAIASTADVAARGNARIDGPVYTLLGGLLTDGFEQLWSNGEVSSDLMSDQFGSPHYWPLMSIWTGSTPQGLPDPGWPLGSERPRTGCVLGCDDNFIASSRPDPLHGSRELRLYALSSRLIVPELNDDLLADFSNDRVCDAADIDLLTVEVLARSHNANFDLNADGLVDHKDRVEFIEVVKNTHFGDLNLDGEFNSIDLVHVLQAGEYMDGVDGNSIWATGDWNGDTEFDHRDIVLALQDGGYSVSPRAAIATIPEPSGLILLLLGLCGWLGVRIER